MHIKEEPRALELFGQLIGNDIFKQTSGMIALTVVCHLHLITTGCAKFDLGLLRYGLYADIRKFEQSQE